MIRQKFPKLKFRKPLAVVLTALLVTAGGVAFALLQSQAKLTGNTIETGTAGLLISTNDVGYMASYTGFDFASIIPGSQDSRTQHFFLKNSGNTSLTLKISAPGAPANTDGVNLGKVNVILTPYDTTTDVSGTPQSFSLQSLINSNSSGGTTIDYPAKLAPGAKEEFGIQMGMEADAANGSRASLSNVDLAFTGVATK